MKKIKIYTLPTCPWCKMLKEFLKEKKIKFEDIDVSSDQKKVEEMVKKSGQLKTPVIDIEGKIIVGFDRAVLEKELGLK
jgi:glutaredoxin-like YruB-family protein